MADMDPADIARALSVYAQRVITPRGSTAVSGLELMPTLRPPTKAVRDEASGNWISCHNPSSLDTKPRDPAPPEATPEHPVVVNSGWMGGFLNEEAYQWVRSVDRLTAREHTMSYAVGLDRNTAFLAAAARLVVGLSAPAPFHAPTFNPRISGSWLVDLSHIEMDPRLPSPFTPDGSRQIDDAAPRRWPPQVRKRRQRQVTTTCGNAVETRACFGHTTPSVRPTTDASGD
ncbi:hypothetical protein M2163_000406 [Streptomyces sp. SAI-135]|uniref:hypothetical protein n=1 Tax=Streptomyces sp. SAI-124 TaxID=3377730 RepID=UPI00247CEA64|nr:hypothetical protein [Streptomyces sp. SAI-090]MDH6613298.1 hypothetical protein [Streptomyces sp. SAI-135]